MCNTAVAITIKAIIVKANIKRYYNETFSDFKDYFPSENVKCLESKIKHLNSCFTRQKIILLKLKN